MSIHTLVQAALVIWVLGNLIGGVGALANRRAGRGLGHLLFVGIGILCFVLTLKR